MVVKATHRGLRNWLIQRISAVIIGLYLIFIVGYWLDHRPIQFQQWHALFDNGLVIISTIIVLIAVLWHAWIGLWTVLTDYIKNRGVRLTLQSLVIILLVVYALWGIAIL